jgi:hypothetical protein
MPRANQGAVLGKAVDAATQGVLDHNKSPGARSGQTDNRDSHFYFALYWAQALAAQTEDAALAAHFAPIAKALAENEAKILAELAGRSGQAGRSGRLLPHRSGARRGGDAAVGDLHAHHRLKAAARAVTGAAARAAPAINARTLRVMFRVMGSSRSGAGDVPQCFPVFVAG